MVNLISRNTTLAIVLVSFMTTPSGGLYAQSSEDLRSFTTIEVTGNNRFRDGDILATSGLRTNEGYTESDIVSAVEALEFTGEFKSVRIFSSGETLTIAVEEEPEYTGALSFGLGFDSDIGVFGSAGLTLANVLGGKDVSARATVSAEVNSFDATVSADTFWPGDRAGGIRLSFADFDYDNTLFDFQTASLQPFVSFGDAGNGFQGEVRFTGLWTDISSIDPDASAIIQDEDGDRFVMGPGVGLRWNDSLDETWSIGVTLDVYGGDAEFADAALSFASETGFIGSSRLKVRGRLGGIEAFGSSSTTAVDRLTLGGSSMRGFARGGITPVDFCAGCGSDGSDVTTRLGGTRYAVLQNDILFPEIAPGLPFVPGLYADFGTVWDVDSSIAPSGDLIEDKAWRSSAGIAVTAETPLGDFSASYALTTDAEDFDDTERFSLSFTSQF